MLPGGRGGLRRYVTRNYLLSLMLILFAAVAARYVVDNETTTGEKVLTDFPANFGGWEKTREYRLEDPVIKILRVDEYLAGDYRKGAASVSLYVGYYHDHKKFAEIHTPENCQANSGWEMLGKTQRHLRTAGARNNHDIHFAQALFDRNGARYVFLYFYQLMDDTTTSFFVYKLRVVKNSILRRRSDAAFVRVIVPVLNDDENAAVRVGEQFLTDLAPVMFEILR